MKLGISKKINLIFFIGSQAIALSIGIYLYLRYVNALLESANTTLTKSILVIDKILKDKEKIINANSQNVRTFEYYHIWKEVYNISKIFKLRYFYILKRTLDGKFVFVLANGEHPFIEIKLDANQKPYPVYSDFTPEEIKKIPVEQEFPEIYQELEGDTALLHVYEDAPLAAYQAFETESFQYEDYKDKYGSFRSAFYPMFYEGKKVGLYGADFEITYIHALQRKAQYNLGIAIILGFAIGLIVKYITDSVIVSKIVLLNKNSKEIANGNFEIFIDIQQKDEVVELAHSFNLMTVKLKESFMKIKEYNEHLEEKVRQRTQELYETLEKVQELKNQQDGDYFLTSLLLNPLMLNRSKSDNVNIQFFIEQKKKFIFKNKEHAIGGDICISGDLNLKGKRYCMFFNADAMGKSMQGAGGVLVIGSIVNSIMARSTANNKVLNITPEEWLLETFYEMNRVMETFDGSMLASCIMGLIEDKTGNMIYFNAEHPFLILYRDKMASFIDTKISAHKLGTVDNKVELFHFQLEPHDVIICGSDGKDDLILKYENENRIINEDETLILSIVEKADADLRKIYALLKTKGELFDDLSLMRIGYKENEVQTTELVNIESLNEEIVNRIKRQDYIQALKLLETYPYENLYKNYYTAVCLSKLNRNKEAIELLENILEEYQDHLKTIRLLGFNYLKLGKAKEAKKYLARYLSLNPSDLKIQKLMKTLKV